MTKSNVLPNTNRKFQVANMAQRRQKNRKPHIKDYMDEICESQDYYRKHVANDGESLFRSISDSVFGSQNYKFIVAKAVELIMNEASPDEKNILSEFAPNYPLVCRLAKRFHFCVEIISAADDTMTPFTFSPKQKNSRLPLKKLLLCFSPPDKFDPIYPKENIRSAGVCQSILYEMLYKKVFMIDDAMTASNHMIYGCFEDGEKPETLVDDTYDGTAMEALEQNLIPFPYKVAKCLDPCTYRNIEYDVWNCQKHEQHVKRLKEFEEERVAKQEQRLNIGRLARGTPCMLRFPGNNENIFGYVQGPCVDRQLMEIYIPLRDINVYVDRSMVLPVKGPPKDQKILPKWPNQRPHFTDYDEPQSSHEETQAENDIEDTRNRNISLITSDYQVNWLAHSDFTIPPPPMPTQQQEQHDQEQNQVEQEDQEDFSKPKPDPINLSHQEGNIWEYEHYAGCYLCQTHESTPSACCNRLVTEAQGTTTPWATPTPVTPQFVMPVLSMGSGGINPHGQPPFLLFSPLPPSPFHPHLNQGGQIMPMTPTLPTTPTLMFRYPSPMVPSPLISPQPFFVFPSSTDAQNQPRFH